eukprot:CAMPEP_0114366206 /NCGR_PEP_ID=MMETSP0101-20121206/29066_1 /TAXON_ID=38822 ORGANISM="Pteridomonas danica, Strain PT" /NCGR_SAMPLE_ID=MMETSP0101 /ASSEMBLY_ACC=CAM_ASM_000211 /LENGTH=1232 /DNA_ID=CAMNT_0001515079 /DNA_START=605 /DNA_END=4300 /DNA_ORIENTATION=-
MEECEYENIDPETKLFFCPENQQSDHATRSSGSIRTKAPSATIDQRLNSRHPTICPEAQYITQSTPQSVESMYQDFEDMFPTGNGEASHLDLKALCDKPDFEVSLVDAIMYDDDELMAASLNLLDGIYGQRRDVRNAMKRVSLLDRPEIPVFGDIHVLKTLMHELMLLIRTASTWGVSSMVSGPFGDKEFGEVMSCLDRIHLLLYDDGKVQNRFKFGQSPKPTQQPSVAGAGGRRHSMFNPITRKEELWSVDVAEKWIPHTKVKVHGGNSVACTAHQDLLRRIGCQEVLLEAILIDPLIARKDGTGTPEDMDESIRRLTMVMRAALSAASAFTYDNRKNQTYFFTKISYLEKLAIPDSLSVFKKSKSMVEGDYCFDDRQWSLQLANNAQLLILSILHKNTELCDKVDDSLTTLFSSIADMSEDLSTAPTLDIIFILVKPGRAPNSEVQCKACKYFMGFSKTNGLDSAVALCMKTAASANESSEQLPTSTLPPIHSVSEEGTGAAFTKMLSTSPIPSLLNKQQRKSMGNPARLLRLLTALMEGGNERVANMLEQRANLTIDLTCGTLVTHIENKILNTSLFSDLVPIGEMYRRTSDFENDDDYEKDNFKNDNNNGTENAFIEQPNEEEEKFIDPSTDDRFPIIQILTQEFSVGAALFSLLVEQIFLLPLNQDQLYSTSLWNFILKIAVPALEVTSRLEVVDEVISEAVGELVGVLEYILITSVRLNQYERMIEDPAKERAIHDVAESVRFLLKHRARPPRWLSETFREAGMEYGIEALNRTQFVQVMEKACYDCGGFEKSATLTNDISAIYDSAHVCGESGLIDMYEFVRLYKQITKNKVSSGSSNAFECMVVPNGHLLRLRTIECAERIDQIVKGHGAGLSVKHFSRNDRFGSRTRPKHSSVQASLFASSHATTTKKFEKSDIHQRLSRLGKKNDPTLTVSYSKEEEVATSIQHKFETFQTSVEKNPLILQALQRRRFSMVNLFENGTPGPPATEGRNISNLHTKPIQKQTLRGRTATRIFSHSGTASGNKIRPLSGSDSEEDEEDGPRLSAVSGFGLPSRFRARSSSTGGVPKPVQNPEENAVIIIQKAYRQTIAKLEYLRMKAIAKPGGGRSANRLSGAIALGWSDIAGRFIRYLSAHFWETGEVADVNILIIETLLAHLIKSRTYFYNSAGVRLVQVRIHKAHRLEFLKPHDLSVNEFALYNQKKEALNELGVTTLLAQILASLCDDVT